MGRVASALVLALAALVGSLVTPWVAWSAGLAPWWAPFAFYLATGPVRWVRWVLAGAWEESRWEPTARGDNGASVGILQYQRKDATAAVRPQDRESVWQSGYNAAGLTVASIGADWRAYLVLRLPVAGYLRWRDVWRGNKGYGQLWPFTLPETTQAREGLAVDIALALAACLVLGSPLGFKGPRKWARKVLGV